MLYNNFNYILGLRGLTSSEKGVLHAMVLRSDENNVCFPSIDTLCSDTGIGKTTVVKCVAALAKGGVISLKKRFSKSTVYTISVSPATLVQPVNYCSERTCTSSASEPTLVQPVKPKNTIKNTKEESIDPEDLFNGIPPKPLDELSDRNLEVSFAPFIEYRPAQMDTIISQLRYICEKTSLERTRKQAEKMSDAEGSKIWVDQFMAKFKGTQCK